MRRISAVLFAALCAARMGWGQAALLSSPSGSTLERVVVLARHGVRSPLQTREALGLYSRDRWPEWPVPPGYLTPHGRALMTTLGAFYARRYQAEGLLQGSGCKAAGEVYLWSDTDERDVSTAEGFLQGLLPSCAVTLHHLPGEQNDPMIHVLKAHLAEPDRRQAAAEVLGRVGGNKQAVVQAQMPALLLLDRVLGGCGLQLCPGETPGRTVVPALSASVAPGEGDHLLAEGKDALSVGSTLSEIFLLEYAEGKPMSEVAFGRASRANIEQMLALHAIHVDLGQETDYLARVQGSALLAHSLAALTGAAPAPRSPVSGDVFAPGAARFIFVAAHDTNLAQIAGMLRLHWYLPGDQQDATPPGSALVLELRRREDGSRFVQIRMIAQSLDQMRSNAPLTGNDLPYVVPVTIPGCTSLADGGGCPLPQFENLVKSRLLPQFVTVP